MQQPALRLALLTFATLLVSGCAEQFATQMVQTSWIVAPVEMPRTHAAPSGAKDGAGHRLAQIRKAARDRSVHAPLHRFGPSAGPVSHLSQLPALLAQLSMERRALSAGSELATTYVVRASDYLQERAG